ncbi:hypothetical protein ACWG0P_07015 [Amedibacillus sp. YH-ame6]
MKKNQNTLRMIGIVGIIVLFIVSMVWPFLQVYAKIGALAIYGYISFSQLMQRKREGEDIEKSLLFTLAMFAVFIYLFFF